MRILHDLNRLPLDPLSFSAPSTLEIVFMLYFLCRYFYVVTRYYRGLIRLYIHIPVRHFKIDLGVMNGNREAYNADNSHKHAKELRNVPVTMGVFKPAASTGDYYIGQLTIPDMGQKGQLFKENDRLLVCEGKAPQIHQKMREASGKEAKDTVAG